MILNKAERNSFEQAVRPLIEWLNDKCHPHVTVIVDCGSAELTEGVVMFRTEDYIKD